MVRSRGKKVEVQIISSYISWEFYEILFVTGIIFSLQDNIGGLRCFIYRCTQYMPLQMCLKILNVFALYLKIAIVS